MVAELVQIIEAAMIAVHDELWIELFDRDGVRGGFTWRGRESANDFSPSAPGAEELRARLLRSLDAEALVEAEQVHGAQVAVLTGGMLRSRLWIPATDAVITTLPRVAMVVRVADCVPVLIWSPWRAVAAVHAGWRGLAQGILTACLREMRRLGFNPAELRAVVGPAIGPCCYEVGEDVAVRLSSLPGGRQGVVQQHGRYLADLPGLATAALASLGIPAANIVTHTLCTACHGELLYSYRREGDEAGRQVAAIVLRHPLDAPESHRAG